MIELSLKWWAQEAEGYDDEIDFIINLTIPASHGPIMAQVIESGKSIYTEKPFTVHREGSYCCR